MSPNYWVTYERLRQVLQESETIYQLNEKNLWINQCVHVEKSHSEENEK